MQEEGELTGAGVARSASGLARVASRWAVSARAGTRSVDNVAKCARRAHTALVKGIETNPVAIRAFRAAEALRDISDS